MTDPPLFWLEKKDRGSRRISCQFELLPSGPSSLKRFSSKKTRMDCVVPHAMGDCELQSYLSMCSCKMRFLDQLRIHQILTGFHGSPYCVPRDESGTLQVTERIEAPTSLAAINSLTIPLSKFEIAAPCPSLLQSEVDTKQYNFEQMDDHKSRQCAIFYHFETAKSATYLVSQDCSIVRQIPPSQLIRHSNVTIISAGRIWPKVVSDLTIAKDTMFHHFGRECIMRLINSELEVDPFGVDFFIVEYDDHRTVAISIVVPHCMRI